jgi:predicted dehydrogenase
VAALRVGLVGAGPWAKIAYLPILTGGPELELVGVWARRSEAAREVAELGGTTPAGSVEELFDRSDAVAFAVPPSVQFGFAIEAAKAGKHLLLDKPLGDTADRAEAVAAAVAEAGVASMVMFTSRFRPDVRRLLAEAADAAYAQLLNLNGAFLAGPFSSSPWRHEEGALLDWGPHGVDMLMAALGPVVGGHAQERDGAFAVTLQHEGGHASQALFSSTWSGPPASRLDLVTPQGLRSTDWAKRDPATYEQVFRTVREEFAHAVRTGEPHPCDARRGAEVQRVVDQLRASVARNA